MAIISPEHAWDPDPVLDLLEVFSNGTESAPEPAIAPPTGDHGGGEFSRLGDLNAVLKLIGKPIDIPKVQQHPNTTYESSSSLTSSGTYFTTESWPHNDRFFDFDEVVKNKEVRFAEDTKDIEIALKLRSKSRKLIKGDGKNLDTDELARLISSEAPIRGEDEIASSTSRKTRRQPISDRAASDFESDVEVSSRTKTSRLVVPLSSANLLTPAWVTPPPPRPQNPSAEYLATPLHHLHSSGHYNIPPDIPHIKFRRTHLKPLITLTKEEKKAVLIRKLILHFPLGPLSCLQNNPIQAATQPGANKSSDGIHVFVDASNIVIGFWNALKLARGLNRHELTKRVPFSFQSLALVLERGRPVAERMLCGSLEPSDDEPDYMVEARQCSYGVSGLKRVEKVRPAVVKRRGGSGYATSGPSSGSDATSKPLPSMGEQGVDEVLQLHMCTSLLEYETPSTMVLATGDAAEAEYSGGFQRYVIGALKKGWKVELVCWKNDMSRAWNSRSFQDKWKKQFRIIHLDSYREELFADYVQREPARRFADGNWTD